MHEEVEGVGGVLDEVVEVEGDGEGDDDDGGEDELSEGERELR